MSFLSKTPRAAGDSPSSAERTARAFGGFLPTGETALFLLAGDDLKERLSYRYLFDEEHFFNKHAILTLEGPFLASPS